MMNEQRFTCEAVAQHLGKTIREIMQLVDKEILVCQTLQGKKYITTESLDHYLDECFKSDHQEDHPIHTYIEVTNVREDTESFSLLDYLTEDLVIVPFRARTKPSVFRDLTEPPTQKGLLWDAKKMQEALDKREKESSTALPNGVALLHPAHPMTNILGETFLVLGIASAPIPFGGGYNVTTDIFFLICSSDRTIHLNIMHRLAHLMQAKGFLDDLRLVEGPSQALNVIADYEAKL